MGKVVAVEHVTLDGVMQGPARADEDRRDDFAYGGWSAAGNDPRMQRAIGARMGQRWALLVGRVTYEDFWNVWPKRAPNPFTDALNKVQKYVASRTLREPLPWQNSTLLKGDAGDAVAELKGAHDETFIIFGSGVLVQSLQRRQLIDEYLLMIHPIVLGAGRRLFATGGEYAALRLVGSEATATGVLIARYQSVLQQAHAP
jgi:dihydrofolate reductase